MPKATTGDKSPGAAAVGLVTLGFDYLAGVGTSQPPNEAPSFSGLTSGFAGLYQINFVVPTPPASMQACTSVGPLANLTITLSGFSSRDVVGICVQSPPVPAQ